MRLISRIRIWSTLARGLLVLLAPAAAVAAEGNLSPQERASVVDALEASQTAFDDLVAGVLEAQLDGLVAHLGSRPDAAGSQSRRERGDSMPVPVQNA